MVGDSRSSRVGFSALPPAPAWSTLHSGLARPLSPPRSSPKAPPTPPSARRLEAPPIQPGPRSSAYPPGSCLFTFVFTPESPPGAQVHCWETAWERQLGEKPLQGGCGRSPRRSSAAPGTGWFSSPARCVPSAARRKSGPLETFGEPERKNRFGERCSLGCHKHTRDLSHTLTVREPKWGAAGIGERGEGAS